MSILHRTAAWWGAAFLIFWAVAGTATAAQVSGFRSAKFGDTEAAVKVDAVRDLGVRSDALKTNTDAITGVGIILAKLPNFAPLNVPATVAYAFGSSCKCLIQITIRWQLPESGARKDEALDGTAALVDKFVKEGWDKDHLLINRVVGEPKPGVDLNLILFRGQEGKSAITMLGGPVRTLDSAKAGNADGASGEKTLHLDLKGIKTVILIYDANVAKPDVGRTDVDNF